MRAQVDHLRDSFHIINASPDSMAKPGTLIQRGMIIPFIITSQPKYNRRRCMKEITKKRMIPR